MKSFKLKPSLLFVIFILSAAVWGFFVCIRDRYFGNFDQADMAMVARNLINGRGYTTDAIWLYLKDWGQVSHPEDIWPLLQPTVTAFFFLLLGPSVAAFMAGIVFFMLAMLVAVYLIAKDLYGPWQGLTAAIILFLSPLLLGLVGFGTNDISATFFYITSMYALYRSFDEEKGYRWLIIGAVLSGLGIHAKFQGVLIPISYAIWQAGRLRSAPLVTIKKSAVYLVVLFAIGLPFMVRNKMALGTIAYTPSKRVNQLAAAWDPMGERWRMNMVYYRLYWEHDFPDYAYLKKHRGEKYLYVDRTKFEIERLLDSFGSFKVVKELPFVLAILGFFLSFPRRNKWAWWNLTVISCSITFVLFGHMETRYFLFLLPISAIFASETIAWIGSRMRESKFSFALLLIALFCFLYVDARGPLIANLKKSKPDAKWEDQMGDIVAFLKNNLKPDEGVFWGRAAEVAFHSERRGALFPNENLERVIRFADQYKIRYLILEMLPRYLELFEKPGTEYWTMRQLAPLYAGNEVYGFKKVYSINNNLYIYRIPRPDEVDLASLPKLPPYPDDFTTLLLPPEKGGPKDPPPPLDLDGPDLP